MSKGVRCDSAKCAMEKQWRQQPPGMHGWKRTRGTEYAVRLREKQKVKRYYGLMDAQFMRFFRMASKLPGNTGQILLQFLERRLDNVVYKLGMALSRANARQMVAHGHILVNGKKVDRPSYLVNQGDKVTIKSSERSRNFAKSLASVTESLTLQGWLQLDRNNLEGTVLALPTREDVQIPVEENLIVEFCSR
jgi:small subunit ribosomal protein S4